MTGDLDWVAVARLRQGLYRFFGAGLLKPDQERVDGLLAGAELLSESGIEHFAFAGQWDRLMETLCDLPPAGELEAEHVRLFSLGTGLTPCPPCESHYLGKPRSGDAVVIIGQLERRYRSLGLTPVVGASQQSDHASTELEVLSAVCGSEHLAWRDGALAEVANRQKAELELLEDHLGRWFHLFANQVRACSRQPLYADITAACAAFLHHDRELLRVVTRESRSLELI